jgi:hypothetical protein
MFRLDGYGDNYIRIDLLGDQVEPMERARKLAQRAALEAAGNPKRRMKVKEVAIYLDRSESWVRRNRIALGAHRTGKNPKGGDLVFYLGDVDKGFDALARKVR